VADEMPAGSLLSHFRDFPLGFLDAIFAEVSRSEFDQVFHQICRMSLADRDKGDFRRITTTFFGCDGNLGLNGRESCGKASSLVSFRHDGNQIDTES
jgi:hypothetical protein